MFNVPSWPPDFNFPPQVTLKKEQETIHCIGYLWLCYKLQLYQLKTANSHYLMISLDQLSGHDGWVSQVKVSEEAVVWLSVSADVSSKGISITDALMLAAITTTTKSITKESPLPNWLVKLMSGFSSFWVVTRKVANQMFSECWPQASLCHLGLLSRNGRSDIPLPLPPSFH